MGERSWSPASRAFDNRFYGGEKWVNIREGPAIEICATFERYFDDSGYDRSFKGALAARLPSQWLSEQMGLRWSGRNAEFVDKRGNLVAFDPSVESAGPPVLLIDEARLRRSLGSDYAAVWLYQGLKTVFHSERDVGPRLPRRCIVGVYALGQQGLEGSYQSGLEEHRGRDWSRPSTSRVLRNYSRQ